MPSKAEVREAVWRALEEAGAAAFPGPRGRIPNFRGSGQAAERLRTLPEWRRARAIKCNPDYAQRAVRLRALQDGKVVYVAVPRLRGERPFLELDPARLGARLREAITIGGAERLGRHVAVEDLPPIDLIVAGTVAADRTGARIGKGGGYSDLEYALLRSAGKVGEDTVIVTTVHPLQVVDGPLPADPHDISLD
ncbi:MAG TPA: 5-formyltetrahydrofolate cyclo-ligase, partial [Dehalococcoidia bacterium]